MEKRTSAIIIPALDPGRELIEYVDSLIAAGFDRIILVDDGSDAEHRKIFDELAVHNECSVLRHAVNLGKGRGLKNAFNYFLNMSDVSDYYGVVTADSDGQHTVQDVIRISDRLKEDSEKGTAALLLGSRDFDLSHVPFKSRWGNRLTRGVFHLLHGVKLMDTQTGLRGVPTSLIPDFIELFGERFEYETNMLIAAARSETGIVELSIETVYENNNEGTHFNPVRDSWAIYKLLFGTFFKYIMASLSSFIIDILMFQLALSLLKKFAIDAGSVITIPVATAIARVISSIYNYLINRNVVFASKSNGLSSLIKYYILAAVQLGCSAALVTVFYNWIGIPEVFVKTVVDCVLFLVSFQIQKRLIFNK